MPRGHSGHGVAQQGGSRTEEDEVLRATSPKSTREPGPLGLNPRNSKHENRCSLEDPSPTMSRLVPLASSGEEKTFSAPERGQCRGLGGRDKARGTNKTCRGVGL